MTQTRTLSHSGVDRRQMLLAGVATLAVAAFLRPAHAAQDPATVRIEAFSADGKSLGVSLMPKVVKTDAQWKAMLSAESYEVARHAGTEPPFHNEYDGNHAAGLYRCLCCGTALYNSSTKFDSGTGWPSFFRPISALNVRESKDSSLFMQRTAISCTRCEGHLGHVFNDGPKPTGLRYCMNSASLHFVPRGQV